MDKKDIKILYMGTPEISAKVLSSILEAGFNVVGVVTNEDRPLGRKKILTPSPVKEVALAHDIPVYQPHRIREDHAFLEPLEIDLILTMAYGQIVPMAVLGKPKFGALNLHGSILPEYRGAAPMQRAIIDGKKKSGCSLMKMVAAMDAGEVYDTEEFAIEETDNYSSVCEKMAIAASNLAIKDILKYIEGNLPGIPQDESKVTIANKIKPEDEHLDVSLPSIAFHNWVRALSETPGGYIYLADKKLKVFACSKASGIRGENGTLHFDKQGTYLILGDGALSLDSVQLEGKGKTDGKSFANGYRSHEGERVR